MLLAHLQRAGGKPIVVLGGGTGLIGDPSGKREERPLLDPQQVEENASRQRAQLEKFLDFSPGSSQAEVVNNAEWLTRLDLVGFLRDVGKHFTVSYMLQKESIKTRLESGISYTEFSYMLLQAYDFLHLYRTRRCELQMGGSDQWGNITAGIELIRRLEGGEAHGLSAPLLTTASGAKFGKTEGGSVWLDPAMTSAYQFYQFWINVDDRDVEGHLRAFTYRSREEIDSLMEQHRSCPETRLPHRELAREMTARVHGEEAADRAERASRVVFGDLDPRTAPAETWWTLSGELPTAPLPDQAGPHTPVVELVTSSGLIKSKSEARRLIQQGGLYVNGERVVGPDSPAGMPLEGGFYWIRSGKKSHFLLVPRSA
jgi:tyrosyl-tRNA synthetase